MQTIDANQILAAIEKGELEAIGDDGVIVLTANGVPFLKITEAPTPQVSQGVDHAVTILSGDVPVALIDSKTAADAERIGAILLSLLVVV